jgi:HB1, ASXL, restriction endonuclease HTH domain
MTQLELALRQSRQMIEAAIDEARTELAALDDRRAELEGLIAQAEAVLGGPRQPAAQPPMTLHEALALILRENDNQPMTVRQLADAVNERGLYRKRDGSPVEVNQVHARTSNYEALFDKDGPVVTLREESPLVSSRPPGIELFRDDDDGFLGWLQDNPDGYFLNSERNPKPTYLVLHRPGCPHFTGNSALHWTKDYIKFSSRGRGELEVWAANAIGGEPTLCRSCFG